MIRPQLSLDLNPELIVVLFAGKGGVCHAVERALGRHVDIACNHNLDAIACHRINHPQTHHEICDVFELDPVTACTGRPVGYLHLSPDCTHFSQASEGQPRNGKIRSLSWVLLMWIGKIQKAHGRGPRVISLENVKQIRKWGPLIAKRDQITGRCLKVIRKPDGRVDRIEVAAPGERVPLQRQFLIPDPKREGSRWRRLISLVRAAGYVWEDNNLVAADYGAPTTRERLFAVTRCDGRPIIWPQRTHAKQPTGSEKPWRPAAECIDWSIPVPSIFTRKRPLAESTCARIAKGVFQFVINDPHPFIVPLTHQGAPRVNSISEPFRTITAANRGELALAVPMTVPIQHYGRGNIAHSVADPFGTVTARPKGGCFALAVAFLAQHNTGNNHDAGHSPRRPFSTITTKGSQQQLVTVAFGGREFDVALSPEDEAGALRCAAFLMRYYSHGGQCGATSVIRWPRSPLKTASP